MSSPSETNTMEYDDHVVEKDLVTSSEHCQQSDSNQYRSSNADLQVFEARNTRPPIISPQLMNEVSTEDVIHKTVKPPSPLSNLKEFPSSEPFESIVPQKIQRRFWSMSVSITSMDSEGEYFLCGTDAGCGFVYNRAAGELLKLSLEVKWVVLCLHLICDIVICSHFCSIPISVIPENAARELYLAEWAILGPQTIPTLMLMRMNSNVQVFANLVVLILIIWRKL